jgi:hypothetical protein
MFNAFVVMFTKVWLKLVGTYQIISSLSDPSCVRVSSGLEPLADSTRPDLASAVKLDAQHCLSLAGA